MIKANNIIIYGTPLKGCTISENNHMVTFFNRIRKSHPEYAAVATHIRNESKRNMHQIMKHKAEGLITGCCDVIIPGSPAFCMEMKSRSPRAKITDEQIAYLEAAQDLGCFCCIALGADAASEAFEDWIKLSNMSGVYIV